MPESYFSEREEGTSERIVEEISAAVWGGVAADILSRITSGAFGIDFPDECPDGRGTAGTATSIMEAAVRAEVLGCSWPLRPSEAPLRLVILDLIEFCHEHVAEPRELDYHSYFGHTHLAFDRVAGQQAFRDRINRIFSRNRVAYQLTTDGRIERVLPKEFESPVRTLAGASTGDPELDRLLREAATKFLDPREESRRDALEKLWDGWERLKTLPPGKDKKDSVRQLLDSAASEPDFRALLEAEAHTLTTIGNTFRIRHSETSQTILQNLKHIDYLFLRMASLIRLLLTW